MDSASAVSHFPKRLDLAAIYGGLHKQAGKVVQFGGVSDLIRCPLLQWNPESNLGSLAAGRFHGNGPAMRLGNGSGNCMPHPPAIFFSTKKGTEDGCQILFFNTRTGVFHRQLHMGAVQPVCLHQEVPFPLAMLFKRIEGVPDQVVDHLLNLNPVTADSRQN